MERNLREEFKIGDVKGVEGDEIEEVIRKYGGIIKE